MCNPIRSNDLDDIMHEIRSLARDIQEAQLKRLGLTAEDVQNGTYFVQCPRCGDWVWAEDGCYCLDSLEPSEPTADSNGHFVTCPKCGKDHWYEDDCPECYPWDAED